MTGVIRTAERRVETAVRALGLGQFAAPARVVRAVEFGAVGATGAFVNAVVFVLAPVAYLLAGAVAFAAGAAWTFALNWTVTYNRPRSSLVDAFTRYASVYVAGFVVYSATLAGGVELAGLPALPANLLAVVVAGTLNFAGNELYALVED